MKNLLRELFQEAQNGKVNIDNEEWPISFNTVIYEDGKEIERYEREKNNASLVIHNLEKFLELLEEYVSLELEKDRKTPVYLEKEKYHTKAIIAYLLLNATPEDFHSPEDFIRRRINMLKDNSFSYLENGLEINGGKALLGCKIKIERNCNPITMETPYRMDFKLIKNDDEELFFNLPSVYYGIDNDTCYFYSILKRKERKQQDRERKEILFHKRLNREFYKVSEGVEQEKDQESIINITHSFLLSLTMFITLLEKENIHKIKVVPYLPLRFLSRELAAENMEEDKQQDLLERNENIQHNITEKFIRLFRRYCFHNQDAEITSYPYEEGEFLTIELHPETQRLTNEMLEEVRKDVKEGSVNHELHRNV